MATFSFGATPGAPGTYINESVGNVATASIASFSTVYMLVETDESVSPVTFPFNTPIMVTSLSDYRALVGGAVPQSRIPLLSFNCVNAFFQNAQIGDLRVVRVGTPNEISEIEIFPSGDLLSNSGIPASIQAGETFYVKLILNGQKLVAGDGSTGFTDSGEWLGVPVVPPVDYIDGDAVNNRKISKAISQAIANAIETNPSVRTSVYVRDHGLVNELDPLSSSENSFVSIAASTYGGSISVVTSQEPIGSTRVFMSDGYDIENIVGQEGNLERVPQDYIQCINTAFDGQQDQGYLITPTAYAQFGADGRAAIGAAAAAHCQDNNFKWMALADAGPRDVTDINQYSNFTPHLPASDLITGIKYLVDNAIYEWTGASVTYDKLPFQAIVAGEDPKVAIQQSVKAVASEEKVGALDSAVFTIDAKPGFRESGKCVISSSDVWPSEFKIVEVTISNATGAFAVLDPVTDGSGTVYAVAPPYSTDPYGPFPSNGTLQIIYLAESASKASSVYNEVLEADGSIYKTSLPADALELNGEGTAEITYQTPAWDMQGQFKINGQESNLLQNVTNSVQHVNAAHMPGTLQEPTQEYKLGFVSRTLLDPSAVSVIGESSEGYCEFNCTNHRLRNGQRVFFTQAIKRESTTIFKATTVNGINPYFVKVLTNDSFLLASSYSNYLGNSFVQYPEEIGNTDKFFSTNTPTTLYSRVLGGKTSEINLSELTTLALARGRKYGFGSGTIKNSSGSFDADPLGDLVEKRPQVSLYLNNSSTVLNKRQVFPYGETSGAGWLPALELVDFEADDVQEVQNFICTPVTEQRFATEAYIVPTLESILGGSYSPASNGTLSSLTDYAEAVGLTAGNTKNNDLQSKLSALEGVYFDVTAAGTGPDGTSVTVGDKLAVVFDGVNYNWTVVKPAISGILQSFSATPADVSNGSGYANGTYTDVPLKSSGDVYKGALATITVSGGAVSAIEITSEGANYTVGEVLTIDTDYVGGGAGVGFSRKVSTVSSEVGDMSTVARVCYGAQVELSLTPEQTPPSNLWRFDAITSTEIIDSALRGVGFNGEPQAEFVEAGVDNVNRLFEDSQRYFNPFGFIAFYGSHVINASGQVIPPSPYVSGVAIRRYRAEGFQFPPAGVKYQLSDAVAVEIPINSAQQNLLNPDGCNAVRTLPGYPDTAVFIWGGRTRINKKVDSQRKFQFVNTRVIQNVVYGSLKNAFDNQIFSVVDGFGVLFNQITSIGTSVLSQLWLAGALFGTRPSDAFQVICDERINRPENLENGLVYVKFFDVPVPTMERLEGDLIRVSIGQMNKELESQGLG